jgi:6-pyruvoyl-tetrahydropterin synthase
MVIDFKDLKTIVRGVVDRLDHRFMLHTGDPLASDMSMLPGVILVTFVPTAENLVRFIADTLQGELSSYTTAWLHSVRLQETPNCYAEIIL